MTATPTTADTTTGPAAGAYALREVSQRVLWLSVAIVDAANHRRPHTSGVKRICDLWVLGQVGMQSHPVPSRFVQRCLARRVTDG